MPTKYCFLLLRTIFELKLLNFFRYIVTRFSFALLLPLCGSNKMIQLRGSFPKL